MKKICYSSIALLVVLLIMASGAAWGGMRTDSKNKKQVQKPSEVTLRGDYVVFDVNSISTYIRNNGSFNRDPGTGNAGFEWPKGTGNTANYASGLWLGGIADDDTLPRVAVAEYSYEYDAGAIVEGVSPEDSRWRVYKIKRGDDATNNPDYANWPFDDGAPYSLDGLGNKVPKLLGDMTVFTVFNDNNQTLHTNMNTKPLGIEIQLTAFAFNRSDALGNTIYYKWKLVNKGGRNIKDAYITVWTDIDLGDSGDDYDGCDTTLGLGYTYNYDPVDGVYGTAVPATGFDFLQGPLVPGEATDTAKFPDGRIFPGKKFLKMTSFVKYNNDATDLGNPNNGQEVYNYMKAFTRSGLRITDDLGNPANFMFPGDPNLPYDAATNWLEQGAGGDRRFLMSSGPFSMAPGDTQEIVAGNLIAQGSDYHNSVTALKNADKAVQLAYELDFNLAAPPPAPEVVGVGLSNQIVLYWGEDDEFASEIESFSNIDPLAEAAAAEDPYYEFEGYAIYQVANKSGGDPRLLQIFDVVNNVKEINDQVFDPAYGTITKVVKPGSDNGIERSIRLTIDKYSNDKFANGKDYYFVVTAYSYNLESVPKTLESAFNVITVRPAQSPMGEVFHGAFGDTIGTKDTTLGYTVAPHDSGLSQGYVIPVVINPSAVTGDRYDVRFAADTSTGEIYWYVRNVTKMDTVIERNTNQSGNDQYPVIDGLMIKVVDAPIGLNSTYGDNGTLLLPENPDSQWVLGNGDDWGMPYFGGGLELGAYIDHYLGFTSNYYAFNRYPRMTEVRFTPGDSSYAYRYRRTNVGGVTRYRLQDMSNIPVSAWDVSNPASPIQLNLAWRDQVADGIWDPTSSYLEVLVVCPTDYDPTGATYGDGGPWENDAIFLLALTVSAGHSFMESPNTISIKTNWSNASTDVFSFSTSGVRAEKGNTELAKDQIDRIMAVPNPYFGANAYERNQFGKIIRFTNLPKKATLRIFNLASDMVRMIEKDDNLTTADWDLRNKNDLPIASGMYIVYIDMPDIGTKILKVAVIMSEERLDNF